MQDLIITTQGKDLITKLVASATKATFTRVVTSNKKYTTAQAGNLTTIQNIQQSKAIDSVYITSDTKLIEAYVKFDNTLVTSGYQVQTVGVYAQETGGTEILYAVSLADSNVDYMPAYDGNNPTAITFRLNVRVENNANVEITIDPAGSASNEALQAVKDSLTTTINSVNTTITTNLNNEITQRKAETSSLTTKLTTETNERKGADTTLQSNIDKEATTRANADTAINTKLDPIKELIDTVFLGEIVKANDKGIRNNKYKPIYFGTVNYSDVGLGTAGDGNTTWHKEAVKVLYTRLKDKGYKGGCLVWGVFQPAMYQWVFGSISISTEGTYFEDASGYPKTCQFISLTYGGKTMYRFGTLEGIWYFETIPTTTQVNTLISNAKTALETAYKNADIQLQTDITTAYQQADTNLSTTLTQAYTDADTALKTELEGKIAGAGGSNFYLKKYEITAVGTCDIDYITINRKGTVTSATISITGPGTSIKGWYAYMLQDGDRYIDGWLCNLNDNTKTIWKLYQNNSTTLTTNKLLIFYSEPEITGRYEKTFLIGSGNNSNITLGQQVV